MNLPTLLVAALVAAVFFAIVRTAHRNRKSGKSACSCGGNCAGCGHCDH